MVSGQPATFRMISWLVTVCQRLRVARRLPRCKGIRSRKPGTPAPAGVEGFLDRMPLQRGNLRATLSLWQTVTSQDIIRNVAGWPLTIDTSDATRDAANY